MEYILLIFIYFLSFFIVGTVVKNNSIVDIGWGIGFVFVAWYRLFTDTEATLPVILMATLISIWGLRLFYHISKRNIGKGEDFRYAKWRKDWGKWLIPRAFFQIYMLQGLFLFIIALPMILTPSGEKEHSWPLIAAGLAIWSFGFFFAPRTTDDYGPLALHETPQLFWRGHHVVGHFLPLLSGGSICPCNSQPYHHYLSSGQSFRCALAGGIHEEKTRIRGVCKKNQCLCTLVPKEVKLGGIYGYDLYPNQS